MITVSKEDYLKAILEAESEGESVISARLADWLKVLIDETRSTLVVAGLPSCRVVINENEQLARRFMASIQLPRFSWTDPRQRGEFISILEEYHNQIAKDFNLPTLYSEEMAFRFFLATGGLIGYLLSGYRERSSCLAKTGSCGVGSRSLYR